MRVGLLTEGGYPYASGELSVWCDRLVRGLVQHEFHVYALGGAPSRDGRHDGGAVSLPPQVRQVRTAPPLTPGDGGHPLPRRGRRRFVDHFAQVASAICTPGPARADDFADGLYGLAALAREYGALGADLRSEHAVRILESACRAPGAHRALHGATVLDHLTVADALERRLRPLSLDWYGDDALGSVDLCHAVSGGAAAVPGLLAKRFFGVPLLVTEYGVQLRAHYLREAGHFGHFGHSEQADRPGYAERGGQGAWTARFGRDGVPSAAGALGGPSAGRGGSRRSPGQGAYAGGQPTERRAPLSTPVRAVLATFQRRLATEVYTQASIITPGNNHARRWQEKCGADRAKLRTVHPGLAADPFAAVGEAEHGGDPYTLVWVGRVDPGKDLIALLHAFAEVRRGEPLARLRLFAPPAEGPAATAYLAHCKALAAQLFPDEAADAHTVGDNPVSFEELGGPEAPEPADAYAAGGVVVLSSVVEGFPHTLVEAMLCGRATVSTDTGAVVEVIGGTGLVVPPRNPRALADACLDLIRDPARAARLGAAARARALELFTADQNIAAFRSLYLEVISRAPVHRDAVDAAGGPLPFGHPAEARVPVGWRGSEAAVRAGSTAETSRPGPFAPVAAKPVTTKEART
ncbi:DUF3492 domain-containing protein [Streptomyces sp. NPDC047315]|uniref:DUF3492 domain-containing protein n=1 Tax=Streptomyces sp. NPDC047315 TaxID=3155142 RepID=UPI0034014D66